MSKLSIKKAYQLGNMFLGQALELLMFDHAMDRGEAIRYLGH